MVLVGGLTVVQADAVTKIVAVSHHLDAEDEQNADPHERQNFANNKLCFGPAAVVVNDSQMTGELLTTESGVFAAARVSGLENPVISSVLDT